MTGINRRRFMQLAGGTAAASALSTSIARAAEIPANRRTGSVRDVEHIVILMQENRSFDHYFGTLRGVRGFGDPHPVPLPERQAGLAPVRRHEGRPAVPARRSTTSACTSSQDLDHGWNGSHAAWNQGKYDQWIPAKTATTMAYFTREDIPFHYALADAFTICDAYHCSLLGPTDPNRYYMWTGCAGNDGKGGGPVLGNDEAGYAWTTYPERLERAGVSWKIYQDVGDGLDADGLVGLDRRRLHRQLRRQLAAVLRPVPQRAAGRARCTTRRARARTPRAAHGVLRRSCKADVRGRQAAAGLLDRRAGGLHRAPELAGQLRRLVHLAGPRRADRQPGGVEQDRAVHHLRRERRLLRPRGAAVRRRRPRRRARSTVDTARRDLRRRQRRGNVAGPVRPGPARADVRGLAVEQGRLGQLRGVRPHLAHPVHRAALRRARAEHLALAPRGLRRPDLGVRLRPHRQRGCRRCPTPAATRPPDHDRHPDYVPTPPAKAALPKQETRHAPGPAAAVRPRRRRRGSTAGGRCGSTSPTTARRAPPSYVTSTTLANGPWTLHRRGRARQLSDSLGRDRRATLRLHGARPERLPAAVRGHGAARTGPEVTARHDGDARAGAARRSPTQRHDRPAHGQGRLRRRAPGHVPAPARRERHAQRAPA